MTNEKHPTNRDCIIGKREQVARQAFDFYHQTTTNVGDQSPTFQWQDDSESPGKQLLESACSDPSIQTLQINAVRWQRVREIQPPWHGGLSEDGQWVVESGDHVHAITEFVLNQKIVSIYYVNADLTDSDLGPHSVAEFQFYVFAKLVSRGGQCWSNGRGQGNTSISAARIDDYLLICSRTLSNWRIPSPDWLTVWRRIDDLPSESDKSERNSVSDTSSTNSATDSDDQVCFLGGLDDALSAASKFYHNQPEDSELRFSGTGWKDATERQGRSILASASQDPSIFFLEVNDVSWLKLAVPSHQWIKNTPGNEGSAKFPNRNHWHVTLQVAQRIIHVDFIYFSASGPGRGVSDTKFFVDGKFVSRGGHVFVVPGAKRRGEPAAVRFDDYLLICTPTVTDDEARNGWLQLWRRMA